MSKSYEIHDITTGEILADNLTFEDMPELLGAYQIFYPTHEIVGCYRVCHNTFKVFNNLNYDKVRFRAEWTILMTENIVNFY